MTGRERLGKVNESTLFTSVQVEQQLKMPYTWNSSAISQYVIITFYDPGPRRSTRGALIVHKVARNTTEISSLSQTLIKEVMREID